MSLFLFLTVVQAVVAAVLVAVILMQRSEGGGLGLGGGGSPGGLMSARGAADFMTRATAFLAVLFVILSIVLAAVAVGATGTREIEDTLVRGGAEPAQQQSADPLAIPDTAVPAAAPAAPANSDPLAGAAE